ncbi:MAG: M23 family metallopeptidase [Pseudomonadota bacterium]|jgi:murein DD-endopeptidase MepM/ murein hydrolase activator NlpD
MRKNKGAILAQKPPLQERKFRLRWLVAASTLPLFGMVAAFGIAPETETRHIEIHTVIENLALPTLAHPDGNVAEFWREERIQRGDTIAGLLSRLNVSEQDIQAFLQSAKNMAGLHQLKPGKTVEAKTSASGELLSLRYIYGGDTMLLVEKQQTGFQASERPLALEQRMLMKSGEIKSSLFAATDAANVPDSIANQLADIFSSDIDFHRDLQKGDKFSVVYEAFYSKGELIKAGRVLSAEFVNEGKTYRAVYFQDREGRGGYYTPEGKNVRKAFLRSPLEFSRISSGFTNARYHPVLKEWRAHKGIDYAAPTGTRVKATADGVVEFVGKQNGYGNVILIKHQGQYSTTYGHLSGFAKGLHKGSHVGQGDVIGYVGMTGLATGPHLHYEFKIAGVQRNPLGIALPAAFPIASHYKGDFNRTAQPLLTRLELLRGTNLAMLE